MNKFVIEKWGIVLKWLGTTALQYMKDHRWDLFNSMYNLLVIYNFYSNSQYIIIHILVPIIISL